MKLWSRGLGKTKIYMDFRYYRLIRDPDNGKNVMMIGRMQDPVTWEFKITVQPEDIGGVMKAVFTVPMMLFILRNLHQYILYLFKRKQFEEGNGDIIEKVNAAYSQVMNPGGNGRARRRERAMADESPAADATAGEASAASVPQEA